MKLENWAVMSKSGWSFTAPERGKRYLRGFIVGHPRIEDGKEVFTSSIVGLKNNKVLTRSGSEYELEDVDPAFEAEYPNAGERLFASLPRQDEREYALHLGSAVFVPMALDRDRQLSPGQRIG